MAKNKDGTHKRKHAEESLAAEIPKEDKRKAKKIKIDENVSSEVPDVVSKEKALKSSKNDAKVKKVKSIRDESPVSLRHEDVDEREEENKESEAMESRIEDTTHTNIMSGEWTKEEHLKLLEQVKQLLPEKDTHDYNTTLKKWDWNQVKIPGKSYNECKAEYHGILKKLRKYKTMTEILDDAREWLENQSDKLKKPSRPHEQFCMAHRDKYISKHPALGMSEIMAKLSKKYEKLPDEKKKKYEDRYKEEMAAYKKAKRSEGHPPKFPPVPMQLFSKDKYGGLRDSDESKVTYQQQKHAWKALKDIDKFKYINESIQLYRDYKLQVKSYCELHPDYTPPNKSILTKAEQKIRDECLHKPKKPPMTGYALYYKKKFEELEKGKGDVKSDIIAVGKIASGEWKNLPEEERKKYIAAAKNGINKYTEDLAKFIKNHPEEADSVKDTLKSKKSKEAEDDSEDSAPGHDE